MYVIIGVVVVFASIIVGYGAHGDFAVLMQPFEVVIIVGAAFGAFLIANPKPVLMGVFKSPGRVLKGPPHKKASYVGLLTLLYAIFRLAKSRGSGAARGIEMMPRTGASLAIFFIQRRP